MQIVAQSEVYKCSFGCITVVVFLESGPYLIRTVVFMRSFVFIEVILDP